jgi:NADPH:quinone reductase-like Zn-dependent oxidoreductase
MKAIIWTAYGPPEVLQLQDIEKPVPKDNEVLIKIHATTVTAGDCETRTLKLPMGIGLLMRLFVGIRKPTRVLILGQEFAGQVESVGKGVTRFIPGDQVFGGTGFTKGTYAEYVCLEEYPDEGLLAIKPKNMSYQEAAGVTTGGLEANHFLNIAQIQPGQKVLIVGAGGSIGTFGIQLANYYGAEVTAVDRTDKLEFLRLIGAKEVIDYTVEDFTKNGQTYDVIFDVVGVSPFRGSLDSLTADGVYLIANPRFGSMIRAKWVSGRGSKKVITEMTQQKTEDLIFLRELIEAGKIKSYIDKVYPLEKMVEAHRYVESGDKKGNLVIDLTPSDQESGFQL